MAALNLLNDDPSDIAQSFTGDFGYGIRDSLDEISGLFSIELIFKNFDLYEWHFPISRFL